MSVVLGVAIKSISQDPSRPSSNLQNCYIITRMGVHSEITERPADSYRLHDCDCALEDHRAPERTLGSAEGFAASSMSALVCRH
jgi:hypothetical protein